MEISKELIIFTGNVLGIAVLVEKVISSVKNWNGSPEIKVVKDAVSAFRDEMESLNTTIRMLTERLWQR